MSREPSVHEANIARQMRATARRGWYVGDTASLVAFGARRVVASVAEPELQISLLLSRDRMHHSVGWWRNSDYEYCWHLSIAARISWASRNVANEEVPRDDVSLWARAIFGEHVDKVWNEPGGTDPRLSPTEARENSKFWHLRVFLNPLILDTRGEPHVAFIPEGEVYHLTRWIPGLTPEKVDR